MESESICYSVRWKVWPKATPIQLVPESFQGISNCINSICRNIGVNATQYWHYIIGILFVEYHIPMTRQAASVITSEVFVTSFDSSNIDCSTSSLRWGRNVLGFPVGECLVGESIEDWKGLLKVCHLWQFCFIAWLYEQMSMSDYFCLFQVQYFSLVEKLVLNSLLKLEIPSRYFGLHWGREFRWELDLFLRIGFFAKLHSSGDISGSGQQEKKKPRKKPRMWETPGNWLVSVFCWDFVQMQGQ